MKRLFTLAAAASLLATPAFAQGIQFNFGPPPPRGTFWENAPMSLSDRIHLVDMRMQRLRQDGLITPAEWGPDHDELSRISILNQELTSFEGGALSAREHNWLWTRLNNLSNRLHWQVNLGY